MMSEKKKNVSDTISQQRKAREEFLELKRMQSGEIDAPPPPSAEAKLPQTAEEKAKNFWYYYRWPVIAVIAIAIVVAICVKQCVSKPDYDLRIVLYTSSPVSDDDCDRMAEYFKQFCEDVNDNGKVQVQVINCSYSETGNRSVVLANNTKVQSIIASEYDVLLYITDETTRKYLNSVSDSGELLEKKYTVALGDDFYEQCEGDGDDIFKIPENLSVSRRVIYGTTLEKNKKAVKYYKSAGEVLDRLQSR